MNEKMSTETSLREWHFKLPDISREYKGKIYTVGVGVIEEDGGMTAVGEVFCEDIGSGANPGTLVCSTTAEAIKYVASLGRAER